MKLKTLLLIPILFAAYLAIIAIGGLVFGAQPDTVNAPADTLVFPDPNSDGLLIAIPGAPDPVYRFDSDQIGMGCYRLLPPEPGDAIGTVRPVWPVCWK